MAFEISDVLLYTINPGDALSISAIPVKTVWKIESAGIGNTKGAIYLRTDVVNDLSVTVPNTKIAILFSTIGDDDYSSPLPFWLPPGFVGTILNDSTDTASVSITVYASLP
jgi:hypothetical protein